MNGCFGMGQALKLAEYKPVVDVKNLPGTLQRVEEIASDAQRFFKNTRTKVVYYEDLVMHPEVTPGPCLTPALNLSKLISTVRTNSMLVLTAINRVF